MDSRLLLLSPEDNVVVVSAALPAGAMLQIEGVSVVMAQPVGVGHKLARQPIAADDPIIKYGASIGRANMALPCGAHVHTHNMRSDYVPTYTHDAGQTYTAP